MFTNLESQYLYSCVQGNDVMFVHFSEPLETGPSGHKFRVLIHESAWERLDRPGSPASREYIMMALAGLDNILIKAAFSERTSTAGISDVSLDTGSERDPRSGRGRASAVFCWWEGRTGRRRTARCAMASTSSSAHQLIHTGSSAQASSRRTR